MINYLSEILLFSSLQVSQAVHFNGVCWLNPRIERQLLNLSQNQTWRTCPTIRDYIMKKYRCKFRQRVENV